MKMGATRSPRHYDAVGPPRAPIGSSATSYDLALRLAGAASDFAEWSGYHARGADFSFPS